MKSAIIINPSQKLGLLGNSIACITSGLFHEQSAAYGPAVPTVELTFNPITRIPILIFDGADVNFENMINNIASKELKLVIFTQEAQFTTNYEQYAADVKNKKLSEMHIIGIGILGEDKSVDSICGSMKLLR